MFKILSLLTSITLIGFLAGNCKTSEKTTVTKKDEFCEISKPFEAPQTITYLPPPADSVSEISINLVGDLMCHLPQTNNARLSNGEYDFNPSFEYIKPYLQDADITIGNLETTFAGTVQPYAGYPAFNSPDAYCTAVKNAGFDFLVTANNHSMDTREAGLLRTIEVIKKHSLGYAGTYLNQRDHDSIRILDIKGIKLGILNYTYGTNGSYPGSAHKYMLNVIDSAGIVDAVKTAKSKGADIVLVFYHMGVENVTEPTQAQKDAVRFALEAGAALVIGAHPHVVGPTQKLYSKAIDDTAFVAYSLGNFLSNQYWRYTDAGVILKVIVQKNFTKRITSFKEASFVPTWVYRGDGVKKMHILFPAQWASDSTKLPQFLTRLHRQKMQEAFDDTRTMLTKNIPALKLNSVK
ncbi:MAG: putative poly-gamma-glutamate biosynthesis protein [Bacteroidetes bacterium]|jgi:poly-gamma-glutamate synthesis protein (capsule biosynthesis protein)|nr:putative poly-gamma-glutamate biosynthesis protein [Bacteroidota bacterium]